jgi:hypothetical protein
MGMAVHYQANSHIINACQLINQPHVPFSMMPPPLPLPQYPLPPPHLALPTTTFGPAWAQTTMYVVWGPGNVFYSSFHVVYCQLTNNFFPSAGSDHVITMRQHPTTNNKWRMENDNADRETKGQRDIDNISWSIGKFFFLLFFWLLTQVLCISY